MRKYTNQDGDSSNTNKPLMNRAHEQHDSSGDQPGSGEYVPENIDNLDNQKSSSSELSDQNEAFIKSDESMMIQKSRDTRGQKTSQPQSTPQNSVHPNEIQLEEVDRFNEYNKDSESEESEEFKEGGNAEFTSRPIHLQNHQSYNPGYGVFNTEGRVLENDGFNASMFNDPDVIDDYYIDNIRYNDTEIREQRTKRIVPEKTIKLTEMDDRRMYEFEKQMQLQNQENESVEDKFAHLDTRQFKDLTKYDIDKIKEQEKRAYYMENLLKKRSVLNIYAIEFDWLFGKQGSKFIRKIANSDSIELFSLEIIKIIILFFWQYYKRRIIMVSLIPFLLYFVTFLAYATFIHQEKIEEDEDWGVWYIVSFILEITILALSAYHIFLELLYLRKNKLKYFTFFWNYVNLITIGLAITTVILDMVEIRERVFIPVAAMGVLMFWLKLFYFGRIMNSTSTIVRMIIEISKDIVPFLFLILVVTLGFTNGFYIIAYNIDPDDDGLVERFTDNNIFLAIAYTWRSGLGDFDTDEFDANHFHIMVYIIWLICTFLILIVFLNLLIAVLSDSFDKIQETLENNLLKEMAIMMAENEVFVKKKRIFKNVKYLFVIKKDFAKSQDKWGGRLDYVNKIIKRCQSIHISTMAKVVENTQEAYKIKLKQRLYKFQQKTDKSLNHIVDRIDRLDTNMKDYKILFEGLRKKF